MQDKMTSVVCWMCGKSIPLEECKTDDHGHVVHEHCYVAGTVQNVDRKSAATP